MKNFRTDFVTRLFIAVSVLVFCFSPGVFAEEHTETDELSDLSLGELLNLEVSVATKTEMRIEEAPSIVSVITDNEIRNMGARSVEDILKTIPGFDVINGSHVLSSMSACGEFSQT